MSPAEQKLLILMEHLSSPLFYRFNKVARQMSPAEQKLLILMEHLSSSLVL